MKRVFLKMLTVFAVVLLFLPATLAAKSPQPAGHPDIHIITPETPTYTGGDSDDEGDLDDLVGNKRDWKNGGGDIGPVSGCGRSIAVKVWWKYMLLVRLLR